MHARGTPLATGKFLAVVVGNTEIDPLHSFRLGTVADEVE